MSKNTTQISPISFPESTGSTVRWWLPGEILGKWSFFLFESSIAHFICLKLRLVDKIICSCKHLSLFSKGNLRRCLTQQADVRVQLYEVRSSYTMAYEVTSLVIIILLLLLYNVHLSPNLFGNILGSLKLGPSSFFIDLSVLGSVYTTAPSGNIPYMAFHSVRR